MKKAVLAVLGVAALAACEPDVPNSAAGVGFGDYETYLRQRETELRGPQATTSTPAPVLTAPLNGGAYGASSATPTANTPPGGAYGTAGYGATPVTSAAGMAAQQQAAAATPAPAQGTIGADTLAALRATAPAGDTSAPAAPSAGTTGAVGAPLDAMAPAPAATAAPVVSGNGGPNLAAYALSATNAPGQSVYSRGGFHLTSSASACKKYVSPDIAQMAFLQKGGPQKDPLNLDPDGDGFACGWDPRPFQMARP